MNVSECNDLPMNIREKNSVEEINIQRARKNEKVGERIKTRMQSSALIVVCTINGTKQANKICENDYTKSIAKQTTK